MIRPRIKKLDKKNDDRGFLVEILKNQDVYGEPFGQIFLTVARPGITKGNHWHTRKREWFFVISGEANLIFEDIKTKEILEMKLSGQEPTLVEIPINCNHKITNTGDVDLYLMAYTNEVYNPDDADTFYAENS